MMRIQTFELTFSLACNFSCKYCYENHIVDQISLTRVEEILNFIKTYQNKTIPYYINLFGGEPLLEFDKIVEEYLKVVQ